MNADMESAQILGAARSICKSIDFEYSELPKDIAPEDLAVYFVHLCLTHTKRGIFDFKSLVSFADFQCLMDFPYLDSVKELEAFSEFIRKLKIKKIQDWWDHKYTSRWIIPCILKSQSKIDPQHLHNLPATTNVGEGQHHWTNHQSGIKLPLVEAILTVCEIDEQVAREVQGTLDTDIKTNSQTNLIHRMACQAQHQSATAWKAYVEEIGANKSHKIPVKLQSSPYHIDPDPNMDMGLNADLDLSPAVDFSQFIHTGDFDLSEFPNPDTSLNNEYPWYATSHKHHYDAPFIYPDVMLPMPPPPSSPLMSSSPLTPSSPLSSPPFSCPIGFTGNTASVIDTKGKKRARDEIDERDILPVGS
ncbi:hypothetical protein B0H34DRAFT_671557 [Crassisporium funariophilum]|nr:hypothetical protein B0H34DRAFT_671557 [Crassisporium funariophilum]